jgi:hypothetical protein
MQPSSLRHGDGPFKEPLPAAAIAQPHRRNRSGDSAAADSSRPRTVLFDFELVEALP